MSTKLLLIISVRGWSLFMQGIVFDIGKNVIRTKKRVEAFADTTDESLYAISHKKNFFRKGVSHKDSLSYNVQFAENSTRNGCVLYKKDKCYVFVHDS